MAVLARKQDTNLNDLGRWASLAAGSSLVLYGLKRRDPGGIGLAALGSAFVYWGATGHCDLLQALGINTVSRGKDKGTGANVSVPYELGIRVDREIRINKPVQELFRFWRNLENLPRFMDHLQAVRVLDDRRSRWTARGPAGIKVEWDAEIINEVPDRLIGWRSLPGSMVDNGGSVHFDPTPDGFSTDVKISLQYNPPAGSLGAAIARLFGEDPRRTIQEDLQRFKELLETGNVMTKPARKQRSEPVAGRQWDRDAVTSSSEESFPASDPPSWTPETL